MSLNIQMGGKPVRTAQIEDRFSYDNEGLDAACLYMKKSISSLSDQVSASVRCTFSNGGYIIFQRNVPSGGLVISTSSDEPIQMSKSVQNLFSQLNQTCREPTCSLKSNKIDPKLFQLIVNIISELGITLNTKSHGQIPPGHYEKS